MRRTSAEHTRKVCETMSETNVGNKVDRVSNGKSVSLPVSRVKLIMKSSPDVSCINQDALFLTTKATVVCDYVLKELFVQHLALTSYNKRSGKQDGSLAYSDLANAAEEIQTFQFLIDILPKKILARDYLNSLKEMGEDDN